MSLKQGTGYCNVAPMARGPATRLYAHTPVLHAFDARGLRRDEVECHPACHDMMRLSVGQGLHAASWDHLETDGEPAAGANVQRQAGLYMMAQVEPGHLCPITMTNACVPTLRKQPELAQHWLPRLRSRDYEPRFIPAADKHGATIGMGMTEKQGGSDVRANTSEAVPAAAGGPGEEYLISGHKWFFSAPMCDAFLVLAQAPGGLSCFRAPGRGVDALWRAAGRGAGRAHHRSPSAQSRLASQPGSNYPRIVKVNCPTSGLLGAATHARGLLVPPFGIEGGGTTIMFNSRHKSCFLHRLLILGLLAGSPGLTVFAQERYLDAAERTRLQALIDSPERSEELRARNRYRNPLETLDFFEVHADLTVAEIWPGGQGGWYRSILEPYLADNGTYIPIGSDSAFPEPLPEVPEGTVDRVLVFRAHGFMIYEHPAQDYFDALYRLTKPGGLFGIVDHRGDEAIPQDPEGENGYVNQSHVIQLAENAGFELIDQSEINANPADTKDHPDGVYSLPPTLRGSFFNRGFRARMLETGESDRMTLKFRRPD